MRAVLSLAAFLVLGLVVSATTQATEKKQSQSQSQSQSHGHGNTAVTAPANMSAPKQAATKSSPSSSNTMKKMGDADSAIIQNQK